jgi:ADP-ribosylglycohydrolase
VTAIDRAIAFAAEGAEPTPERIERLGSGWTAEEALSIALYCALAAEDFEHGIRIAVNHSGDSDSTGALTGSLLGVMAGVGAIGERWLAPLELRDVIAEIAGDLAKLREGAFDDEAMATKYPRW